MSEETNRPGVLRRMGRGLYTVLKMTVVTLALIAAIAGIGWLIYLGISEANRSFDGIQARIDANERRIDLLRDDSTAATLAKEAQEADVDALHATIDEQAALIAALQTELDALSEGLDGATATGETAVADTAALAEALIALQTDINDSNGRIDALGGEIDGLRTDTEGLDTAIRPLTAIVTEGEAAIGEMERTVVLFHLWNLVGRARQQVLENNLGLASADLELALQVIDALPVEDVDGLEQAGARLGFALLALPDDPETAVRDLDTTWNALNRVLLRRLAVEFDAAAFEPLVVDAPVVTETLTTTESVAPIPTIAPTATPTTE